MVKQYPLRIDSVLKEQLEEEAKNQKRSFNNLVEVILTEFMDNLKNIEEFKDDL